MDAYDKLPKTLRKALQDSSNNWDAFHTWKVMKKRKIGAREAIRQLRAADARIAELNAAEY